MKSRFYQRFYFIINILILVNILCMMAITAQEEEEIESAEISAYVDGNIPPIQTSKWTSINITIEDRTGIDWERFKDTFFNDTNLRQIIKNYLTRIWWNIIFPFPVNQLLGYTSFHLTPEIVQGNPNGWFIKIINNTLIPTTTDYVHHIVLEARTEESLIDYAVTIRINCTRYNTVGGIMGISYIYIPVRASPLNNLKLNVPYSTIRADLNSVEYLSVDVTNMGNYRDVFQFDVEEEDEVIGLLDSQVLVLNPGESKKINLSLITYEKIIDFGTANKINIYAWSDGDPNKIIVGSIAVFTQGVSINQYIFPVVALIISFFIVICLLLFFKLRRDIIIRGKPKKPWRIKVEREYLKGLKKEDKKRFKDVIEMMKQEYQSALLWYESYKNNLHRKQIRKKSIDYNKIIKKEENSVKEKKVESKVDKSGEQSLKEMMERIQKILRAMIEKTIYLIIHSG